MTDFPPLNAESSAATRYFRVNTATPAMQGFGVPPGSVLVKTSGGRWLHLSHVPNRQIFAAPPAITPEALIASGTIVELVEDEA